MLYRYKIKPESPVITPLMSDTFFGHFCWAWVYAKGEESLEKFLRSFGSGQPAPVLFSSAFPEGCLPRPALPSCSRAFIRQLVERHYGRQPEVFFKGMADAKRIGKQPFITIPNWQKLKDNYSEAGLMELLFLGESGPEQNGPVEEVAASNVINRATGKVPESGGGLFSREKLWHPKTTVLDLYVEINDSELLGRVDWFLTEFLPGNGFGADKSVGMGAVQASRDESFSPGKLDAEQPNAGLCLSLTAFPGMGNHTAFYRLKTKFGRLGGSFAVASPTGGQPRPFKKPVIMYEPGAVIMGKTKFSHEALLSEVHSDKRIKHCGIPTALAFHVKEEEVYGSHAPEVLSS